MAFVKLSYLHLLPLPALLPRQRLPGPASAAPTEKLARIRSCRRHTTVLLFDVGVQRRVREILLFTPTNKIAPRLIILRPPLAPRARIRQRSLILRAQVALAVALVTEVVRGGRWVDGRLVGFC